MNSPQTQLALRTHPHLAIRTHHRLTLPKELTTDSIYQIKLVTDSPCLKNSSQTRSLHCLLRLHSRHGLLISAHFKAI